MTFILKIVFDTCFRLSLRGHPSSHSSTIPLDFACSPRWISRLSQPVAADEFAEATQITCEFHLISLGKAF